MDPVLSAPLEDLAGEITSYLNLVTGLVIIWQKKCPKGTLKGLFSGPQQEISFFLRFWAVNCLLRAPGLRKSDPEGPTCI